MTAHPLVAVSVLVGVSDPRVLEGVGSVPRAAFVSPELAEQANLDRLLPIPHGQVTTQPSLVAWMLEALELEGSERVLEIGTGYGWQTALLGRLAAEVWSVERWDDLAEAARTHLARQGASNVDVVVGDGSEGLPEHAPTMRSSSRQRAHMFLRRSSRNSRRAAGSSSRSAVGVTRRSFCS